MKRVLSACLQQTIRFESRQEFEEYTRQLDSKQKTYHIDAVTEEPIGSVVATVRKQYNAYPVGKYLD
ncbi:MAG: hypothetical protein Q4F79_10360 [Eubacteriales bacterium]|nr:hypothetical protein [Eubacteriales bacterium]